MDDNNKLVMETLLAQNQMMGRIEATIESMDKKLDRSIVDAAVVEKRVSKVEGTISRAIWVAATAGLFFTGIWELVKLYFTRTN